MHYRYSVLIVLIVYICNVNVCFSQFSPGVGVPLPISDSGQGQPNFSTANLNGPSGSNVPGPGSLRNIPNPELDKGVKRLLSHNVLLSKVQKETNADSAVKIESVLAAHKQVAAGLITYLDLRVHETVCPVGVANAHGCQKDMSQESFVCEVAVWERPWLNSTRVIDEKSKCAEVESETDFKNWDKNTNLSKIEATHDINELPPFLSERQIALEAFDYVDRGSDSKFKGLLVNHQLGAITTDPRRNVTIIETQIEYAFTLCLKFPNMKLDTRICPMDNTREKYICLVRVVSAPSLTANLKVLPGTDDDIHCEKASLVTEELVVPVAAYCLGCPTETSVNSPSVIQMADFALTEFDRTSDEDNLHMLVKLIKAQTQVVAGLKYTLTLELAETHCKKSLNAYNMNRTLCQQDLSEETKICLLTIWEQSWLNSKKLIDTKCEDRELSGRDEIIIPVINESGHTYTQVLPQSSRAAPLLGAVPRPPPPPAPSATDGAISGAMQKSIDDFVSYFNHQEDADDGYYKLLKVHKVSTKAERGEDVHMFTIELGETICKNQQNLHNCALKPGEDNEMCSVVVAARTDSLGKISRSILSAKCDDADEFIMKSVPHLSTYRSENKPIFDVSPSSIGLPGGPIKQALNSSSSLQIANFVVEQVNLQEDDDEYYKLGSIINIFSQVAGNVKYLLELELLETQCKKYQPVADVSLCPVKAKEEPEICQAEVIVMASHTGTQHKQLSKIYCDDKEDFYIKKLTNSQTTPLQGHWKAEDFTSAKAKQMGKSIADEFDARSDKDHIFVLHSILDVQSMDSGLKYHVKVELAETVCPKYKHSIEKSRCAVDIGEDLKICEADILDQPWKNNKQIEKLVCYERDESGEGIESKEVLYRDVHPTAHARPKFLSVFTRQHSRESDESNDRFYRHGGQAHVDSDEIEDRHFLGHASTTSEANSGPSHSSFFPARHEGVDSENDSRSHERPLHLRTKRSTEGGRKLLGGSESVSTTDARMLKVASSALLKLDDSQGVANQRKIVNVLTATRKLVQGYSWTITASVYETMCARPAPNLSSCSEKEGSSRSICTFTIHDIPWMNSINVTKAQCHPEN